MNEAKIPTVAAQRRSLLPVPPETKRQTSLGTRKCRLVRPMGVLLFLSILRECRERCCDYIVRHQLGSQQSLEYQAFCQSVEDTDQLMRWHRQILFFRHRAEPLLADSITVCRHFCYLRPQFLICERVS